MKKNWKFDIGNWIFLNRGFTMVELLVVMAILLIIFAFTSINILSVRDEASLTATTSTLIADIRQQQVKAMIGDTYGNTTRMPYSVHFLPDRYIVYPGLSYSASNPDNYVVELNESIEFLSTIQDDTIIFASGSGEFANYSPSANELTVRVKQTGEEETIVFNKYGTVIDIQ